MSKILHFPKTFSKLRRAVPYLYAEKSANIRASDLDSLYTNAIELIFNLYRRALEGKSVNAAKILEQALCDLEVLFEKESVGPLKVGTENILKQFHILQRFNRLTKEERMRFIRILEEC